MKSILPIADLELAKKVMNLGFHEPVSAIYRNGILVENGRLDFQDYNGLKETDVVSAPYLQEIQIWLSRKKRLDVLVYRDVFFNEVGNYYGVVIRRKDNLVRETKRAVSYNLALEAGVKTAVNLLCKIRKRK